MDLGKVSISESDSRLRTIQEELRDTEYHMAQNIEKLLGRGTKLEDIENNTYTLAKQSDIFNKKCKRLTWYSWFYNHISYIFAGSITSLMIVMYLIL